MAIIVLQNAKQQEAGNKMERSLSMEVVRVTESAAISSAKWMGRGLKNEADDAATTAMRQMFDTIPMHGRVVIGEGEIIEDHYPKNSALLPYDTLFVKTEGQATMPDLSGLSKREAIIFGDLTYSNISFEIKVFTPIIYLNP